MIINVTLSSIDSEKFKGLWWYHFYSGAIYEQSLMNWQYQKKVCLPAQQYLSKNKCHRNKQTKSLKLKAYR